MLPGKKWVLETKREYEIYIEVYDTDSHKIFPSDVSILPLNMNFYLQLFYINAKFHIIIIMISWSLDQTQPWCTANNFVFVRILLIRKISQAVNFEYGKQKIFPFEFSYIWLYSTF